jgi:hypothetical protein
MSDKTKFWLLLVLFILSLVLVFALNSALGQQILVQPG